MNKALVEGQFGHGAIPKPKTNWPIVGKSSVPFNWTTGFDITHKIGQDLVTKNQGQAFDCGMGASNYLAEVLGKIQTGVYVPQSDHYGYSKNHANGGGMSEPEIQNAQCVEGITPESVFPSYPSPGVLPTEDFMENAASITAAISAQAVLKDSQLVYLEFSTFDDLANACEQYNGIVLGIYGQDGQIPNWLSANPQPPQIPVSAITEGLNNGTVWAHYAFVGKAGLYNSLESLGIKNTWGASVGINGWQWLNKNYLPYIWCAFALVPKSLPTDTNPTFKFNNNLSYGMTSSDVAQLQIRLGVNPTGYFGGLTLAAVILYQITHGIWPDVGSVGPLTRASLNK